MERTTAPANERDQLDAEAEQTTVSVTVGVTPNVMPETPIVTSTSVSVTPCQRQTARIL